MLESKRYKREGERAYCANLRGIREKREGGAYCANLRSIREKGEGGILCESKTVFHGIYENLFLQSNMKVWFI